MKILSYTEKENKIKIRTDSKIMPEFVYFKNQFKNIKELKIEMERKIQEVTERKTIQETEYTSLKSELDKEVTK